MSITGQTPTEGVRCLNFCAKTFSEPCSLDLEKIIQDAAIRVRLKSQEKPENTLCYLTREETIKKFFKRLSFDKKTDKSEGECTLCKSRFVATAQRQKLKAAFIQ